MLWPQRSSPHRRDRLLGRRDRRQDRAERRRLRAHSRSSALPAACEQPLRDTLTLNQNNSKMVRVRIDIRRATLGFFVLYLDA
jgi:hypothetical protein